MDNSKCLTDQEIINYVNNQQNWFTKNRWDEIVMHVNFTCGICSSKVSALKVFKNTITFRDTNVGVTDDDHTVCKYSERVEDYLDNKLDSIERNEFIHHIAGCEECREFVGILYEVKKNEKDETERKASLDENYLIDVGLSKNEHTEKFIEWETLANGIKRLIESLYMKSAKGNNASPEIMLAGSNFRSNKDEVSLGIVSREVTLPNGLGDLIIVRFQQKDGMNKLTIRPGNNCNGINRIEIYGDGSRLLKSVDGFGPVSCVVSGDKCLVIINNNIELPIEF